MAIKSRTQGEFSDHVGPRRRSERAACSNIRTDCFVQGIRVEMESQVVSPGGTESLKAIDTPEKGGACSSAGLQMHYSSLSAPMQ